MKKISVIVSVYNEEKVLPFFYKEVKAVLEDCPADYEILFVNDGSTDRSIQILREFQSADSKVRVVNFSRNFGHEAAMIAGIDYSNSDGVICMDADLQHPPECIHEIIEKFNDGYEVISMVRTKNADAGLMKNITSGFFYKILNWMSPVKFENNASDFFALTKKAVDVLKQDYREKVRFLRGFVQNIGFEKTTIFYEANKREFGESKYSIGKLMKFSVNALFSFSDMPLKLGIFSGMIVGGIGLIVLIYTIITKILYDAPSGYPTIIVLICFMFAISFTIIGVIGEYIALLFAEVKNRPIYIVKDVFESGEQENKDP